VAHRHLFVIDPMVGINPLTDSTYDIMLECQSRGHVIWECQIQDLIVDKGEGRALSRRVSVKQVKTTDDVHFDHLEAKTNKVLSDFNFVWMRKDPPVDNNFVAALHLLASAAKGKSKVVNSPQGLLVANEKLWPLTHVAHLMPKTVVSSNQQFLFEEAQRLKKVALKPLFLSGGAGVMVFDHGDKNLKAAIELLTSQGKDPIMLQQFIEGADKGDKRIILIGGDPVGAVLRVPGTTDHRANLHVGGTAHKTDISEKERQICAQLKPLLLANGLHFVGIDVINGFLTEVNVTSPTGLQEIDRLNKNEGKDRLRSKLIDYMLAIH